MVRNYIPKKEPPTWTEDDVLKAMKDIEANQLSICEASKKYKIPKTSLLRKITANRKNENFNLKPMRGNFKTVFSASQEEKLVEHILNMQKMFFGVTPIEMRKAAYVLAEKWGLKYPFNADKKMAGEDWFTLFFKRHSDKLFKRKPEATSLQRIRGFNRTETNLFFDNLLSLMEKFKFKPSQIFNIDETGISKVQTPTKILAAKGQKQVGRMTSAERGKNMTMVCAMSPTGFPVPPFFVFYQKRMENNFLRGAPGCDSKANGSGWMDSETFLLYLDHFIKHVRPFAENPILLILDGHNSHKTLPAILKCKENHIELLSLPPHTSHRLQPLDVSFFGPFKGKFSSKLDDFTRTKVPDVEDTVKLAVDAYNLVANVEKAVNGFNKSGIFPINRDIFDDDDYYAAECLEDKDLVLASSLEEMSNQVPENCNQHLQQNNMQLSQEQSITTSSVNPNYVGKSKITQKSSTKIKKRKHNMRNEQLEESSHVEPSAEIVRKRSKVLTPPSTQAVNILSPDFLTPMRELYPIKKYPKKKTGTSSTILTSTPKILERQRKMKEKNDTKPKRENPKKIKKNVERKLIFPKPPVEPVPSTDDQCLVCGECFTTSKNREIWIQCNICSLWAHRLYTDYTGIGFYVCDVTCRYG